MPKQATTPQYEDTSYLANTTPEDTLPTTHPGVDETSPTQLADEVLANPPPPPPDTTEIGVHDNPETYSGPVANMLDMLKSSAVKNIAFGAPDSVMTMFSTMILHPIAMAGEAAIAAAETGADLLFDPQPDKAVGGPVDIFLDHQLSLQSKAAAHDGAFGFLNYEPATDTGQLVQKPFAYVGQLLGDMGKYLADSSEAGINNLADQIRARGVAAGTWTPAAELRLQEARTGTNGILGAVLSAGPATLAALLPALGRAEIAPDMTPAQVARYQTALQKKAIPFVNLQSLENFRKEPVELGEAIAIHDQFARGAFSPDISIETFQGRPTRILSGEDAIRSLQLLEQNTGIKAKTVNVRFIEKSQYTPEETILLNTLARSGFGAVLANEVRLNSIDSSSSIPFKNQLIRQFVDASGNVKRELLKSSGDAGKQAVQEFELIAGATPRAQLIFQDLKKVVWGDLGPTNKPLDYKKVYSLPEISKDANFSEHDLFDYFAHAKRAQEIVRTKPGTVVNKPVIWPDGKPLIDEQGQPVFEKKFKSYQLEGPISPDNAPGVLFKIKQLVGDKRYSQFEDRLSTFHDVMRKELGRLRDGGLISDDQFGKMIGLNYLTRKFVQEVDPKSALFSTRTVSVGDSGIPFLDHGTTGKAFVTDVQKVAAEHIVRIERRIARNEATKALATTAGDISKDGTVTAAPGQANFVVRALPNVKVPKGYTELNYIENGGKKSLWMQDALAQEWTTGDQAIASAAAQSLRMLSGSSLVKALATGYNPEFALRNVIRDIQHIWRATGTEYSSVLPLYLGQIFSDMSAVAKDAWTKQGAYREYIMEGGGMEMFTHQGRDLLSKVGTESTLMQKMGVKNSKLAERLQSTKEVLSHINEFSELVTRLAIRKRVIDNQKIKGLPIDTKAATWAARRYLDFSQGGSLTKAIDTVIPYLNANIQAVRTGIRPYFGGMKSVATVAMKDAQLIAIKSILQGRYWQSNPEEMKQVSDSTLINSFIIPTGMVHMDDDGKVKPLLLRFPIDNSVVPLTGPLDLAMKKYMTGDNPSINLLDMLKAASPVQVGVLPPTMEALIGMATNHNFYTNAQIWDTSNPDNIVKPGFEYSTATPEFYRLMGQIAPNYISPDRLRYAVRTIAPNNTYIYSAELLASSIAGSKTPAQDQQNIENWKMNFTGQLMRTFPGLRSMVVVGQPAEAMTQIERQALEETNSQLKVMREQVGDAVHAYRTFKDGDPRQLKPYNDVVLKFSSQYSEDPMMQKLVTDTFKTRVATDMVWSQMVKPNEAYFPTKEEFVNMGTKTPETRAKLFFNAWKAKPNGVERDRMLKIAGALDRVGGSGSFLGQRFMIQFEKEKKVQKTNYFPILGGDDSEAR